MRALCFSVLVSTALTGCVSVDSRDSSEKVAIDATRNLKGRFSNTAFYSTKSTQFIPPSTLEGVLDPVYVNSQVPAADVADIDLESGRLTIHFEKQGRTVRTKQYSMGDDLQFTSEGKLQLLLDSHCEGGHDSPTVGACMHKSATFFLNDRGDLVVTQSSSAVGTVAIVPVGIYARWVAIFRPLRD